MTPKHPTPWHQAGEYVRDANGVLIGLANCTSNAAAFCIAANEIGKPSFVNQVGGPVEAGHYILYSRYGSPEIRRLGERHPIDAIQIVAWLRLPDLPIEDEFEKWWNQWPDREQCKESKGFIRQGWEAAKSAK